jgi:putative transposase
MPDYRRAFLPGGTFFFTVVAAGRRTVLTRALVRGILSDAIATLRATRPFRIDAMVLLPNHLHCIWTLSPDDSDYSVRWRRIKSITTRRLVATGFREATVSASRRRKGEHGIWQRRFWEHTVRDEAEYETLCDYIHYNPVKHEHTACPHDWPYSTFARFVKRGHYDHDWCCTCPGKRSRPPELDSVRDIVGE